MRLCSTDFRWNRCRQSSRQHRRLKRDGYVASWSGLYLLQDEPWWILIFARWTCPNVVSASCHVAPIAGAATPTRNASSARGKCRGVINSWWIGGPTHGDPRNWMKLVSLKLCYFSPVSPGSFAKLLRPSAEWDTITAKRRLCSIHRPYFAAFCMDSWWGLDEVTTWQFVLCPESIRQSCRVLIAVPP